MYECKQSYRIARLARPGGIQRERKARSDIRRAIRCEVINTYGGKCVCCDEIEHRFLTIDHVNGDGKNERNIRKSLNRKIVLGLIDIKRYQLSCANCVDHKSEETWFCNSCGDEATAKTCGSCGSKTKVIQTNLIKICQSCKGNSLGEPETLITQLPSEFFSIASKIKDTYPDLIEVHRKFDFSLTLVRLCRLANLVGFPQIEEHLRKCSIGLQSITERGIEHISRIRKEASFDLRNMDNFKNIELEHYRNANTILQSTYDKINKVNTLMRHWIEQVIIE
ncbi:hypothetical protein LCGC14_2481470 [marine sediment metagenome]|uniref:Uncharacterized protein n=1 Tax=marine sediment metagenome TaxID=412755 RepID=A0A0F9BV86_9ZZZZ